MVFDHKFNTGHVMSWNLGYHMTTDKIERLYKVLWEKAKIYPIEQLEDEEQDAYEIKLYELCNELEIRHGIMMDDEIQLAVYILKNNID